jgi:hypothetical protein
MVKVFSLGKNEEHKVYYFEVAAHPGVNPEDYDKTMEEIQAWCVENFPPTGRKARPRFHRSVWHFVIRTKTDASAFRLRWC